ncbi:MAG: hypothetical protein JSU95_14180 [Betaproteobacteria bacterium]|nr:MAG: hypothetical protein JSU95_14180 [Betaproteobacteria bacterium]
MINKICFTKLSGIVPALVALIVAGCGGGGGGPPPPTGPVTSTLSFPLLSADTTQTANGFSFTLNANGDGSVLANGDCTGTINGTQGPAKTATTFEGAPALSATRVTTINFTNCFEDDVPATIAQTSILYYTTTYSPLGYQITGSEYAVFTSGPAIPTTVMVGDAGVIGSETIYTDSTKTVIVGSQDMSFVVEPDTANTAIINISFKLYNAASVLEFTEQDRYRITSAGALTLISIDLQRVSPPLHIVFK